ncbi:DExH-box ATP-dependent RNA helicase DExH7, chloroplastic isoform X7 [Durio zibethinus]|uniref:RNA helicase n=1 Tax=Durio zibethinus TaxID=66656 RepID=A0A6P5Z7D5_DURZI|nr:DExH-box ATP-dependent RNA helicase DExH7, chloroplastic isoform X7 [Durio zibethinus]
MAPKKKPLKQGNRKPTASSKTSQASASAPRLQISAENENRLRRLLLNSGHSSQFQGDPNPVQDSHSKTQKAKKLKAVYEKLSCEGFSNDQIELALSSLKDTATFEAALDWLCLNLPRNELPLKFTSGISLHSDGGGPVNVISFKQEDWTPSVDASTRIKENLVGLSVRTKGSADEDSVNTCQPSQADWIRQYMEQQEEDESKTWEDEASDEGSTKEVSGPRPYDVIAKEYHAARLEATKAKEKGNKKGQEKAGNIIRKLKQELSALGLSDDILESDFLHERASACVSEDMFNSSIPEEHPEVISLGDEEGNSAASVMFLDEATCSVNDTESSNEFSTNSIPSLLPAQGKGVSENMLEDVEIGDFFLEDTSVNDALPPEVLKLQKKEKMKELYSEKNLEKLDGIWKKGEPKKIPKAVLHQLCQRSGWEAPKFNKMPGKGKSFTYSVSVLRKSSGRGKSRKAGGLVTFQLPHEQEAFEFAEDAQNRVAAFALCQLFPDLPVQLVVTEPYSSLIFQWKEGEPLTKIEDSEEDRRAGFVDRLLNADDSRSKASSDDMNESAVDKFQKPFIEGNKTSSSVVADPIAERRSHAKEVESLYLRQEEEKRKQTHKYKEMLKTRAALPIAVLKNDILQLLKENNVLVVCGETGSGKTTQVPQFILDDMIESGQGGHCNIICTQPRRIASGPVNNRRGKKNLVLSAWGDDSLLSEDYVNPNYNSSSYQSYSDQTQQNLKRLNEDVIDYDLLEDLVCHVDETCDEGAILIFLPGVVEIHTLLDRLAASYQFGPSSDWLLPLHSSIASTEQKKVFLNPPDGIRKVIIATNIAETSITIDDVVYVIDCGKHKENRYNPQKKLSSMVEDWISRANAKQRRGRAGRVKPGICFCLYTQHRFEKLMRPYQVPEMLRMPLVELCLQIKLLSLGHIKPFLSKALEPPKEEAMNSAISLLYEVGAVEGDEELTPLGHHLAKLPVDVLIGKMLLYGGIFGCLSPVLSISAFLSYKSPFLYPKDEKQNVERAKLALLSDKLDELSDSNVADRQSDHLLMMVAYRKWEKIFREKGVKAAQRFCNMYFLSSSVMYMIRDMRIQFGTLLADIGFINLPKNYQTGGKRENLDGWFSDYSQPFNMHSHHSAVVKAILCAGLYPNVAATELGIAEVALSRLKHSPASKGHPVWYDGRREVHIHPSSINSSLKSFQHPFLVFLEKVETNKVFLRDTTIISPFSILLFGGLINIQHQSGLVTIDGWLKLTAPAQTAVLCKELRSALHSILKELIRKPENATIVDNEVVRSMINLLLDEDKPPK